MYKYTKQLILFIAFLILSFHPAAAGPKGGKVRDTKAETARHAPAVLWRDPIDIESRNLLYGSGGKEHAPPTTFTFEKEDLNGTNPKFVVRDSNGTKWTVKLGAEARPETVATRLVWAAGYFTNEDYFLPQLRVQDLAGKVKRGRKLIGPDGVLHDARLKRHIPGLEKAGHWEWDDDPFTGTRELNGLKVMMALINNWDLKDVNNEIYKEKHSPELIYMVSDLGASFGSTGHSFPHGRSKGDLGRYRHSKFIARITPDYVDFRVPSRPALLYAGALPSYIMRIHLERIGRHIPRADAKWMGKLLARLSPDQIRDAFRAGGYSAEQVEGFSQVVLGRIAELTDL